MWIDFESMPDTARVWVYQSNRTFSELELDTIQVNLKLFCEQWTAHRQVLNTSFLTLHNRFVILAVDESLNEVSGCSIDSSVHILKKLEEALSLSLLDKSEVAYWKGEEVRTVALPQIKAAVDSEELTPNTLIFNNLIKNIAELKNQWQVNADATWLKRYFKKPVVLS
jgi:hypothetical protein